MRRSKVNRIVISAILTATALTVACTWGHGEWHGEDYRCRIESGERVKSHTECVRDELKELEPSETVEKIKVQLDFIDDRAQDEIERGWVRLEGEGFDPGYMDPTSDEADQSFIVGAGLERAKAVRRHYNPASPPNVAKGVSNLKEGAQSVGTWMKWGIIVAGLACLALCVLWVRSRLHLSATRAQIGALEARKNELEQACIEYDNEIEHHLGEKRRDVGTGKMHLQREHLWINKDRKDAQRLWEDDGLLPIVDDTGQRMNKLGEETRRRRDSERDPQSGIKKGEYEPPK